MTHGKTLPFESLVQLVSYLKSADKKIVYAQGFFDLLHVGHAYHLEQAKKLGDILIVGVVSDEFFKKRGGRPLFKDQERLKLVPVLDCVDFVTLINAPDAIEAIKKIKPDVYAKGEDVKYKAANPAENLFREIKELGAVGGKIKFTKSLPLHSTEILAKLSDAGLKDAEIKKEASQFIISVAKNPNLSGYEKILFKKNYGRTFKS